MYRVNANGQFNVPYGFKNLTNLFDIEIIRKVSDTLKKVTINCIDFEESLKYINKNDLVFLDPPYTISHIKNGFIHYNEKLFAWQDQERLAEYIRQV